MGKQGGLGDNLYVDGYDLSGDTNSFNIGTPLTTLDMTGIDKSCMERAGGLMDGSLQWVSFFDTALNQAHSVYKTLPRADRAVMATFGTLLGNPGCALVGKQVSYDGTRDNSGAFTFKLDAEANGFGLEHGHLLTAGKRTDTTATNGTGVDFTAVSTAFGWSAYLHVFAITGTSVTVKIQDSADNSTFTDLTSASFPAASAIGSARMHGSATATVRRYLRVVTSGTFTSATFAVLFCRNAAEVDE